jgi:ankyrin repeat protein
MTHEQFNDDFEKGLVDLVHQALADRVDINTHPKFGATFLDNAIASQYHSLIELLVSSGINVDGISEWGDPPLVTAYRHFYSDGVRLLRSAGARTDCIAAVPVASLLLDAIEGNCASVERLLNEGVEVDARGLLGRTALICAAGAGQLDCVRLLLDRDAEVDAQCDLDFGPDPDAPPYASNALVQATTHGFVHMVELLLDHGANIEGVAEDSMSPLSYAAFDCREDVAELLLARGANIHGRGKQDYYRDSPLALASWMGNENIVRALLKDGAGKNSIELQAAYRACYLDNGADIRPILREAGAQIRLIEAVLDNNRALVSNMLAEGADPNEPDGYGSTPLMYASTYHSCSCDQVVVRSLLSHGANINARNREGKSARELLMQSGHETWMPDLLRQYSDPPS